MRSLTLPRQLLRHYSKHLPQRARRIWQEKGWKGLLASSIDAFQHQRPIEEFYAEWIRCYDTVTPRGRRELHGDMANWTATPLLSVIMPVRNPDLGLLRAAVRSVFGQLYPHWELCIVDDVSTVPSVREELRSMAQAKRRIRLQLRAQADSIHADMNSVWSLASGQFIAFFEATDLLHEHALYWIAKEIIEHPQTDLIFSDEDKIDASGSRSSPCFKPDWNPALMLSCNAFGHLGVIRRSLVEKVGGFRPELDGSRDYDLVLRCARRTPAARIRHIPRILYHQRAPEPAEEELDARSDALDAGRRAVEDHLLTSGIRATVSSAGRQSYRVEYALPSPLPRVSILLPSTCEAQLLEPCLRSLITLTTYENFEVALLINEKHRTRLDEAKLLHGYLEDSRVRVLAHPDLPFNYPWVNNWGASQTSGDLLCFLNDDTMVVTPDWIERLAARLSLPGVAVAGPTLYYPDDTIQHAGVILGLGGVAGHACQGLPKGCRGYFGRACLEQDVSCLTAACMMTRSSVFRELGGFDEILAIAFNDVDLCMRARAAGWRIIWTPSVELYHRESTSIGRHDSRERVHQFAEEVALMRKRWGAALDCDPFYNPNLSLMQAFHLAFPPRQGLK